MAFLSFGDLAASKELWIVSELNVSNNMSIPSSAQTSQFWVAFVFDFVFCPFSWLSPIVARKWSRIRMRTRANGWVQNSAGSQQIKWNGYVCVYTMLKTKNDGNGTNFYLCRSATRPWDGTPDKKNGSGKSRVRIFYTKETISAVQLFVRTVLFFFCRVNWPFK